MKEYCDEPDNEVWIIFVQNSTEGQGTPPQKRQYFFQLRQQRFLAMSEVVREVLRNLAHVLCIELQE
jgi:hypothetical protein